MAEVWTNFASSTLSASLNNSATSFSVASGDGALFPSLSGSDYFYAVIVEGSTKEIVKVTARSTDTFTVTRAQQGTSAGTFTTAATVKHGATKDALNRWESLLGATQSANRVFAGPSSGSAAVPTFRALVPADIPSTIGPVLLESRTASSSAQLDLGTRNASGQSGALFQSDYDQYAIEIVNLIPATNSVQLYLRMSVTGSVDSTSGNYSWDDLRIGPAGAAAGGSASGQAAMIITGGSNVETIKNTAADGGLNGSFRLFNPLSATAHKHISGQTVFQSGNNATYVIGIIGGKYINTAAIDGLRFLMSSGNITSGVIRVYGIPK